MKPSWMNVAMELGRRAAALASRVAPLLTRAVLGQAFLLTGIGKWRSFEQTTAFFDRLGLPAPAANAAFIATLELVGGGALLLGAGTRAFAALLSGTMVVALMTADGRSLIEALTPGAATNLSQVVPIVFLALLTGTVTIGPGALSVDAWILRRRVVRAEPRASWVAPTASTTATS